MLCHIVDLSVSKLYLFLKTYMDSKISPLIMETIGQFIFVVSYINYQ
jgi:hypothetical protein